MKQYKCFFCKETYCEKKLVFFQANYHTFDGLIELEIWDKVVSCYRCLKEKPISKICLSAPKSENIY